jgi:bifunctional DNA-binding transcriptional regulator/antitoxin component of YhaV-PrlF toxin-antitoxin module
MSTRPYTTPIRPTPELLENSIVRDIPADHHQLIAAGGIHVFYREDEISPTTPVCAPAAKHKEPILAKVRTVVSRNTPMAKITSKYQVTLPKAIAEIYQLRPGDEIDWVAAGEVIRVLPPGRRAPVESRESRLLLFDQATERNRRRGGAHKILGLGLEAGEERISTGVAALVDTNVLVYRFDNRFPEKQKIATRILRRGIIEASIRLPHQAVMEFVAAVTRPVRGDIIFEPA